jgi:hypothetical protein
MISVIAGANSSAVFSALDCSSLRSLYTFIDSQAKVVGRGYFVPHTLVRKTESKYQDSDEEPRA